MDKVSTYLVVFEYDVSYQGDNKPIDRKDSLIIHFLQIEETGINRVHALIKDLHKDGGVMHGIMVTNMIKL